MTSRDQAIKRAREITEEIWTDAADANMGWCNVCLDWTRDEHTEPDAEKYECPICKGRSVYGAEYALMAGMVELVEPLPEDEDRYC